MKKKFCFLLILFVLCSLFAFADEPEDIENSEEVEFLLFMPNSSNLFANERQAIQQLDRLARFLIDRDLNAGQIYVYGHTAYAQNDIEPEELARNRALFIMSELQKRGVPDHLFAEPIAY